MTTPEEIQAVNDSSFTLSAAGLEVKPDSAVKLTIVDQKRTAGWSVRAATSGAYTLVLNTTAGELSLKDMPSMVAKINSPISGLIRDGWPSVSAFFGSLPTLPGTLAYLKDRRSSLRKRSPIIIP